jgi:hypothetical protein
VTCILYAMASPPLVALLHWLARFCISVPLLPIMSRYKKGRRPNNPRLKADVRCLMFGFDQLCKSPLPAHGGS